MQSSRPSKTQSDDICFPSISRSHSSLFWFLFTGGVLPALIRKIDRVSEDVRSNARRVKIIPIDPTTAKKRSKAVSLPIVEPNAAGIDVGATQIFVAVPGDRDSEPIQCFQTFTADLQSLADWLQQCRIRTVAMESTGVYWIPLFQILEQRKIDVRIINAHHVKNVPGRKTDVADCQWIQHLHACGLLRGSFRPHDEICAIRSLWRHRDNLIELATIHLQHMQKALDQMNVQLHHVISDLAGTTGLAIVDAILAGERDSGKLAELRDWRIRATKETIMKSLVGDYREEHIFTLRQSLKCYRHYQGMIEEVDRQVKGKMQQLPSKVAYGKKPPKEKNPRKTPWRNEPPQLRDDLYRAFGVDLTQVAGNQHTDCTDVADRGRPGPLPLSDSSGVQFMAPALSRSEDQRWASAFVDNQTYEESGRSGITNGCPRFAPQPEFPWRLLSADEGSNGHAEGDDRRRLQARQNRLSHGHEPAGIRCDCVPGARTAHAGSKARQAARSGS